MAVDIVLLLFFIVCILSGYRKGLILSLCGLLMLALSCLGAAAMQQTLTPRAADWMEPKVTAYVAEKIQSGVEASTEKTLESTGEIGLTIGGESVTLGQLADILNGLGLDVQESEQGAAQDLTAPLVQSVAQTVSRSIVETLAGLVIFLAAFLVIYLLLRGISLIVNLVDLLPVVHTLNHVGGAVIGGLTGALLLTVLMGVLVKTGLTGTDTFGGPVANMLERIAQSVV